MTPTCERCNGPGERTDGREWICPRCGIWINVAGEENGPPVSPEQAAANYERFVIETAARMVETARVLVPPSDEPRKVHALTYDGLQLEHEDGWVYEYVAGQVPRRVKRVSTSAIPEKK